MPNVSLYQIEETSSDKKINRKKWKVLPYSVLHQMEQILYT